MLDDGWPLLVTLHHPITVDRQLALSPRARRPGRASPRGAGSDSCGCRSGSPSRSRAWSRFPSPRRGTSPTQMGVHPSRMSVVPVGVDHTVFRPRPERPTVPGRIMVTSSSDVPMKGLVPLLEAVAKLRTERDVELLVIGRPARAGGCRTIERLGLEGGRPLRERDGRQRARRALCGGAGGRRPVSLRRILVAGDRGDGVRTSARRHHRRGPAGGGR